MQSAAGGTSQRLKPGPATECERSRKCAAKCLSWLGSVGGRRNVLRPTCRGYGKIISYTRAEDEAYDRSYVCRSLLTCVTDRNERQPALRAPTWPLLTLRSRMLRARILPARESLGERTARFR